MHCGTTTLDTDIHVDTSYCIGTAATNINLAFTPIMFIPKATYAEQLPNSFYTRRLLHQEFFIANSPRHPLDTAFFLQECVFSMKHNSIVIHFLSRIIPELPPIPKRTSIIILLPSSTVHSTVGTSGHIYFNKI